MIVRPIKRSNWPTVEQTSDVIGKYYYNEATGQLHSAATGKPMTALDSNGCAVVWQRCRGDRTRGRFKTAHVVWLLCKGAWPVKTLTFKDSNPCNCAIDNLVEADDGLHTRVERKVHGAEIVLEVQRSNGSVVKPFNPTVPWER